VTGYRPADEDAPMRPTNVYEQTKAQAELAVCAAWSRGFPAVIARPGLVYGPGDLHLLPFFAAVLKRRFHPIGRRTVWLHPIYIDDLTEALVRCGDSPHAEGECFHLAGPSPVSLSDFAQAVADAGGTRCPRGHFPLPVARAAAALSDLLPGQLKRRAPLTRRRLDFLTHSRVYDVTKAQRQLGFTAATGLSSGMAKAISWYRSEGYLAPDSSVGHLSEDRAVAGVGL
jgi:nucleoside-diphosphate-sugar epimerase